MRAELIGEVFDKLDVVDTIKNAEEDIDLVINTEGGSVFEGLQIVNAIQNSEHKVNAHIEVMACSIGAVVALACDKVFIDKNSLMMMHNCWTIAMGNKKDLQEEINAMQAIDTILQNIVSEHCYDDSIKARMEEGDVWLTGEQVAELFDNAELIVREKPMGMVAEGSLVHLLDKFNILQEECNSLKQQLDACKKDEIPEEKEEEKEENTDNPSENEEKEEKKDYVVSDELKALLDRLENLE